MYLQNKKKHQMYVKKTPLLFIFNEESKEMFLI